MPRHPAPARPTLPAPADVADAILEATVVGSFSRAGLEIRSRLLPQFTADLQPPRPGRVAVITGATSGLGLAAASSLAARGMNVHFLARSELKARTAQQAIASAATAGAAVTFTIADVEDLASVRRFGADTAAAYPRVDVLIHCAGAMHEEYQLAAGGTERTVTGHVLAPFLLTSMLLPALTAARGARVITVSSGGMYAQRLDLTALAAPDPAAYRGAVAYARAKRAQVTLNREWALRLRGRGITFCAMHPGWADTPGIVASLPRFHQLMKPVLRSPEQGADTIVWLATAPAAELPSGKFWHDRRPRAEYWLPWTREAAAVPGAVWDWAAAQTGVEPAGHASSAAPR